MRRWISRSTPQQLRVLFFLSIIHHTTTMFRTSNYFFFALLILLNIKPACSQPPSILWTWQNSGSGDYKAVDAIVTDSGAIIYTGSYAESMFDDTYPTVGKVSAVGDSVWMNVTDTLNYWKTSGIIECSDGTFMLCGSRLDTIEGIRRQVFYHTSSIGSLFWARDIDGEEDEVANTLIASPDGGYVTCGFRNHHSWPLGYGLLTAKVNSSADTLWTRACSPSSDWRVEGNRIIAVQTGGYAALGFAYSLEEPLIPSAFYFVRLNENGDTLWTRMYYGEGANVANEGAALCETDDGGFILAGNTSESATSLCMIRVIRTDANGVVIWDRVVAQNCFRSPWVTDIIPAWGGGWALTGGIVTEFQDGYNYLLMGISDNGDSLWSAEYPTGGDGTAKRVLCVPDGYVLVGTVLGGGFTQHRVLLIKVTRENLAAGDPIIPTRTNVFTAYPNPFNSTTTISFTLTHPSEVKLNVYDVLGRSAGKLPFASTNIYPAGSHQIKFDGSALSSGIYFVQLQAGGNAQTKKMMLLK